MELRRQTFPAEDLELAPEPKNPVVLKSGGPIMDLETVEGENGLCRWETEDSKIARATFPLACLYLCRPVVWPDPTPNVDQP